MTPQFVPIREIEPRLNYIGCLAVRRDRATAVCLSQPERRVCPICNFTIYNQEGNHDGK